MALHAAWELPLDAPVPLVRVTPPVAVALAADGTLLAFDPEGRIRWSAPTGGARAMAISGDVVVTLGSGAGGRFTLTGRDLGRGGIRWATSVVARRMTRLFASEGVVHATLSRDGRFLLETYRAADGAVTGTRALDRRRGMVALDGRRAWTRDERGLSEHDLRSGEVREVRLEDGPMTEAGPWLVTSVGASVVGVRGGAVVWRTPLGERDLTEVGRADGLEDDDEEPDVWEAELGRPTIAGDRVYVADLSGRLHSLALDTGALRWTAHSEHYPSAERPARVASLDHGVVWPSSDEMLYLVEDSDGSIRDALELPFPFEGTAEAWGPLVLLPGPDGIRAYRVG